MFTVRWRWHLKGDLSMRYELVVIWSDGDKEVYAYRNREKTERTAQEMKKVFGNQISWIGVREKRISA